MDVNINDLLGSELFWVAVAALVPLSVAVGSLITLGVNAIAKHRSRPEADWAVDMVGSASLHDVYGGEDGIQVSGKVSNVGDGGAFRVHLQTRNCTAGFSFKETQGMSTHSYMQPGSVIGVWVAMDLSAWDTAEVELVWTEPPTRLGKQRRYSIAPRDFMDVPGVTTTHPETGKVYERPISEALEELRARS